MSKCSNLCSFPETIRNTNKRHCPLCHLRYWEYNWPPYNMQRCQLKFSLGPIAQELDMDLIALRDDIESKFVDPVMFKGILDIRGTYRTCSLCGIKVTNPLPDCNIKATSSGRGSEPRPSEVENSSELQDSLDCCPLVKNFQVYKIQDKDVFTCSLYF